MNDMDIRGRLLRLQRMLIERPFHYTNKALCERLGTSRSTLLNDFAALKNAGYIIEYDNKYRYGFKIEKNYGQLKDLLHFTEEDQFILTKAIDQVSPHSRRGDRLKKKLHSIYDFGKLGHAYLRRPYLNKLDTLLLAKSEKKCVRLKDYRSSNSNAISDRLIEAFHPSPADDILHAYDVEKKELRRFRISRMKYIELTHTAWQFEQKHHLIATDPFRIVDDVQEVIHLRLAVGAYNELIERFPLTASYIQQSGEREFDLQCHVNHQFLGLTNFILGHHRHVLEIISSDRLRHHITGEMKAIQKKWKV